MIKQSCVLTSLLSWLLLCLLAIYLVSLKNMPAHPVETQPVLEMTDMTDLHAELNCRTVQKLYAEDKIIILDVREHWEYDQGHIPGARLIPLGKLSHHINEIPADKEVALVCERGIRSGQAQRLLIDEGFDNVHNMLGGMVTWRDRGYKVET